MNIWDIVIIAVVLGAVVLGLVRMKKHKGGCNCSCCEGCCEKNKKCSQK